MSQTDLSEATVRNLTTPTTGNKVYYFAGKTLQGQTAPRGFGVRVTKNGSRSFILNYRAGPRERRYTIGEWKGSGGGWSVLAAIKQAVTLRKQIDLGADPVGARAAAKAPPDVGKTVGHILDEHVRLYIKKTELRSAAYIERTFDRLVKPRIGEIGIRELRRSQIVQMLDEIETENGPVMADRTLAHLRKAFNWHATRDDDFVSPIVKGMARTRPRERARSRSLSDEEIREVWAALDSTREPYPAFLRALLLTAQRRSEVSNLRWDEIESLDGADLWVIPAAKYKTKIENVVPISPAVRRIIGEKPKDHGHFVFSTTKGTLPFSGHSKAKRQLDSKIAEIRDKAGREPMPAWTHHDLRRTARTLMSRAGVSSDTAERVLGHVIGGVRGTYDRHSYLIEKRIALERLSTLVDRILNPTAQNVTPLRPVA